MLILAVILIWYMMGHNSSTASYTKSQFESALADGQVATVNVVQNREIPTGSLQIAYTNGQKYILYTSDVNECQTLMDKYGFTEYTCQDVPTESWIMTLLPYLLIFGAFFILFVIMNNNAAAQNGGGKMMNFGKHRANIHSSAQESRRVCFS